MDELSSHHPAAEDVTDSGMLGVDSGLKAVKDEDTKNLIVLNAPEI